jgi:hypothetical protein
MKSLAYEWKEGDKEAFERMEELSGIPSVERCENIAHSGNITGEYFSEKINGEYHPMWLIYHESEKGTGICDPDILRLKAIKELRAKNR